MFKIKKLTKDTTISSNVDQKYYNAGKSEQAVVMSSSFDLVNQVKYSIPQEKRYLCKFDATDVYNSISGSYVDNDIILNVNISNLIYSENYSITAYPLSSSFVEGLGNWFNSKIGSTWLNKNSDVEWTTEGGDYLNTIYTASINEERKLLQVDVSDYVESVHSGSLNDNGIIFIVTQGDVDVLSLYTKDTKSGLFPYVSITYDDKVFITGSASDSAVEYTANYLNRPFEFVSYNHKNRLRSGDTFLCQVDIMETYRRKSINYDDRLKYIDGDIYYRIIDKTRGRVFIDYNDKNKISLNDYAMYLQIDTTNFPDAVYSVELKYADPQNISINQELIKFVIDD